MEYIDSLFDELHVLRAELLAYDWGSVSPTKYAIGGGYLFLMTYIFCKFSEAVKNLIHKIHLYIIGVIHLLTSRDKKWQSLPDPDLIDVDTSVTKRIIFIRHGESEWNQIFNKEKYLLPIRLVIGQIKEFFRLPTRNSVFVDAALNGVGVTQAKEVSQHLMRGGTGTDSESDSVIKILRGESQEESVVVASNLRRAIQTCVIALKERLQKTSEPVHILTACQEVTFNVDGISLLEKKEAPVIKAKQVGLSNPHSIFDVSANTGTKLRSSNGLKRMEEFNQWAFARKEDTIIVTGHSLYFRYFFKEYLPRASDFEGKTKKMKNCAVVSFDLQRGKHKDGTMAYKIAGNPTTVLHGFEGGKQKK